MTIDPETLMAYADGELDDLAAKRVERAIAEDPTLARQIEAHRALTARLGAHFDPIVAEPVPDHLKAQIQTSVADFRAVKERRDCPRRAISSGNWAAMVATLVVGLLVGQAIDLNPPPVSGKGGALFAQGSLEKALDTQLASTQPRDAKTRIGLTFRDSSGAICRTFEARTLAGIACRVGDDWQLRQLMGTAPQQADYRQAGSAEILAAAEPMMADGPFDADVERAALRQGWR